MKEQFNQPNVYVQPHNLSFFPVEIIGSNGDGDGDDGGDSGGDGGDSGGDGGSGSGSEGVRNPDKLLQFYEEKKAENKSLKDRLSQFDGIDPKEIKALRDWQKQKKEAEKTAEEERLRKEQQYEALYSKRLEEQKNTFGQTIGQKDQRIAALEKTEADLQDQIKSLQTQITRDKLYGETFQDFISLGGVKGDSEKNESATAVFDAFWGAFGHQLQLDPENGERKVMDSTGKSIATDSKGKPLTTKGFLQQLAETTVGRGWFETTALSGTGGKGSNSSSVSVKAGQKTVKQSQLTNLPKGITPDMIANSEVKVIPG